MRASICTTSMSSVPLHLQRRHCRWRWWHWSAKEARAAHRGLDARRAGCGFKRNQNLEGTQGTQKNKDIF